MRGRRGGRGPCPITGTSPPEDYPPPEPGVEPPATEDVRSEFAASAGDERIALFLPDGSAAAVRELWITDGARAARIAIDPLLGEVRRVDGAPRVKKEPRE